MPAAWLWQPARSLRTRRQRWAADGTLPRLMEAGAPVIRRIRNAYFTRLRAASDSDSPGWKTSSEFFRRRRDPAATAHELRGRYANRRR